MSAIDESLWFLVSEEAIGGGDYRYKVFRYNIYEGDTTEVYTYDIVVGSIGSLYTGFGWDGGFHVWFTWWASGEEHRRRKRINIRTLGVEDWPVETVEDFRYADFDQDWGRKLVSKHYSDDAFGLWAYDFASKQWGQYPTPLKSFGTHTGITCVPPWATYQAGNIFAAYSSADNDYFQMYDWSGDEWIAKADMLGIKSGGGGLCWADYGGNEYVYLVRDVANFDRYNVNTNAWSNVGAFPGTAVNGSGTGDSMCWDGDQYLFYCSEADDVVYRFDLNTQVWDSYISAPVALKNGSICYTPRIRFILLDQDCEEVAGPVTIGSIPKGRKSTPVKYYLKALAAEASSVTLGIVADARTDADDILELALDVGGIPGSWGTSVNLGTFSAEAYKPFWIRCDAPDTSGQEAKIARFKLTMS